MAKALSHSLNPWQRPFRTHTLERETGIWHANEARKDLCSTILFFVLQRCVVVQEVFPDGLIAQDGRLRPGDQIIEINGVDMTCANHLQVNNLDTWWKLLFLQSKKNKGRSASRLRSSEVNLEAPSLIAPWCSSKQIAASSSSYQGIIFL